MAISGMYPEHEGNGGGDYRLASFGGQKASNLSEGEDKKLG